MTSGEPTRPSSAAPPPPTREEDIALRDELVRRLEASEYNVSQVARDMGKARQQIQRWIRRFGLKESR
jgi:transposase-like protein